MAQNLLTGTSIAFIGRSVVLGVAATDIVPASDLPANSAIELTSLLIANKDTVARTFAIYRKVAGGTSYELIPTISIAANTTEAIPLPVNLEATDSLTGLASVASMLVVTASGKKYS
jgi:hypothetical protein